MRNLAGRLQGRLEMALTQGMNPDGMADIAVSIWVGIASVFSPIVGVGGTTALFRRAVSVTLASHPVLNIALQDTTEKNAFVGLHQALADQSSADVVKANAALLQNFCELLATLIGGPLTERLLEHLPDHTASGDLPQRDAK